MELDGTATVLTVDGSGTITSIALTTGGSGYSSATGAATTVAPSGGTGATVNTVVNKAVASVAVGAGGSNYLFSSVKFDTTYGSGAAGTVSVVSGAKKVLIPVVDMVHIGKVPPELLSKFQLLIYSDPIDAVFKAIGVD